MTGDATPPRLLVVEDEAINRTLLRAVLDHSTNARIRASEVVEAGTLAEARRLVNRDRFDLVLLDVRLPDGNGLDLAREIDLRDAADRPKIVILSASVMPDQEAAATEAGCDAFLAKPYRPGDLVELIERLVLAERLSA